jgi:hypothetical protein
MFNQASDKCKIENKHLYPAGGVGTMTLAGKQTVKQYILCQCPLNGNPFGKNVSEPSAMLE